MEILAIALAILMVLVICWQTRERFAAIVDPEQYVNSTLTAKF